MFKMYLQFFDKNNYFHTKKILCLNLFKLFLITFFNVRIKHQLLIRCFFYHNNLCDEYLAKMIDNHN